MEEAENGQTWNKKRIIIALFVVALLAFGAYFLKNFVLGRGINSLKNSAILNNLTKAVAGENVQENPNSASITPNPQPQSGVQKIIQEKLNSIKQEITTLDLQEIASSSPQFQKIINDLQSLQQYPRTELKDVCQKVCGGL